jgi:hypothetical protein
VEERLRKTMEDKISLEAEDNYKWANFWSEEGLQILKYATLLTSPTFN